MDEQKKVCNVCKVEKPHSDFYLQKGRLMYKCKECTSKQSKANADLRRGSGITAIEKRCSKCKEIKPASEFNKSSHTTTGLTTACCACLKKIREDKFSRLKKVGFVATHRLCTTCAIDKHSSEFRKNNTRPDGLWFECKPCAHDRKLSEKEKHIATAIVPEKKVCHTCSIEKSKDEFNKDTHSKDLLCFECKDCVSKRNEEKYASEEFKIKNRARVAKWNEEHPGANSKRVSAYYQANKEAMQAKALVREKKKYASDIYFNLTHRLRRRFRIALKGRVKSKSVLKLLGCSLEDFKVYFSEKFTEGMTWEKYMQGIIDIEHIIPCSFFDLSLPEEQGKCYHFKNLQPMWKSENRRKYNKIEWTPENIVHLELLDTIPSLNFPDELSPSVQAFYAM